VNSFERHGISHLSASSLNLWRGSPGIWALRYIAKIKDGGNAAMWRGSAVENGLASLLHGQQLTTAITAAYQSFDLNAKDALDDDTAAERELIAPMVTECAKWKAPSSLNASQLKIEYFFDPVPIPVIGYVDFCFDGIDIDCKSTKACPSSPRSDHIRQVSIYRAARNRNGGLLYVTGKRHQYFEIDDESMNIALEELRADALSLNNFLARCEGREDALRSLPVDWSHYAAPKTKIPLADLLLAG
jgi:hypothetical protein